MMTENEKWRDSSDENQGHANGYNRTYNRENRFRGYNNERQDSGYRSYRSGSNGNRTGGVGERPQRPRFTRNTEAGGEFQQRSRYTRVNGRSEGAYSPKYSRPQHSYDNSDGMESRPYRKTYQGYSRPRVNNGAGEERPWREHSSEGYKSERPQFRSNARGGNAGRPYQGQANGPRRRTADYNPNAKYSRKKQIEYKEILADPNAPIRLNKYLANAGICSRREADEFITAGVVSVNGEVVTELGTKVTRSDVIKFHDQLVSAERKVYILLNKPKDCVTTSDDPQDRKTVMDLVKGACAERIYPVGRLDRNTTGVLLLTNDGDLASKLTHPKYLKKKIYHVYCDKNVTKADLDQIAAGITLEDGEIHADAISYAHETDKKQVGIEIHSGKNRIVRRIFESLGYRVTKLDRVFFAGLTKKNLRRGDWRFLTEQEVNMLRMGAFA